MHRRDAWPGKRVLSSQPAIDEDHGRIVRRPQASAIRGPLSVAVSLFIATPVTRSSMRLFSLIEVLVRAAHAPPAPHCSVEYTDRSSGFCDPRNIADLVQFQFATG